jgi:hypothetical protein
MGLMFFKLDLGEGQVFSIWIAGITEMIIESIILFRMLECVL